MEIIEIKEVKTAIVRYDYVHKLCNTDGKVYEVVRNKFLNKE